MGLILGSQELVDAIAKRQEEDPEFRKTMKGLTVGILFAATDCPGNEDRQYAIKIENGRFTGVGVDIEPAPSPLREPTFDKDEFDFKAIGDYKSFSELLRGKIDLVEWITKTKLEGDFGKSLSQLTRLTVFLDVLSTMDLELQDSINIDTSYITEVCDAGNLVTQYEGITSLLAFLASMGLEP